MFHNSFFFFTVYYIPSHLIKFNNPRWNQIFFLISSYNLTEAIVKVLNFFNFFLNLIFFLIRWEANCKDSYKNILYTWYKYFFVRIYESSNYDTFHIMFFRKRNQEKEEEYNKDKNNNEAS